MKYWSRQDEEQRLCSLWLQDPLINPATGHPIDRNGPTWQQWKKRCNQTPKRTGQMTWRKCQEWHKNPSINPDTGKKISVDGPTYKSIQKQCTNITQKDTTLEGEYYLPDRKGMVPCVLADGRFYGVRTIHSRKVWGPLNKPAKDIKLCYYKDTWDYKYEHYRPIFIGGNKPPERSQTAITSARIQRSRIPIGGSNLLFPGHFQERPKEDPKHIVDNIVDLFLK